MNEDVFALRGPKTLVIPGGRERVLSVDHRVRRFEGYERPWSASLARVEIEVLKAGIMAGVDWPQNK